MKQLITQLRLALCEWLLWKAFQIAPHNDEGFEIRKVIANYFGNVVRKKL